jgi:hypothetical protein
MRKNTRDIFHLTELRFFYSSGMCASTVMITRILLTGYVPDTTRKTGMPTGACARICRRVVTGRAPGASVGWPGRAGVDPRKKDVLARRTGSKSTGKPVNHDLGRGPAADSALVWPRADEKAC